MNPILVIMMGGIKMVIHPSIPDIDSLSSFLHPKANDVSMKQRMGRTNCCSKVSASNEMK